MAAVACGVWVAILTLKESTCNSEILFALIVTARGNERSGLIAENVHSQILNDRAKLIDSVCISLCVKELQLGQQLTFQVVAGA